MNKKGVFKLGESKTGVTKTGNDYTLYRFSVGELQLSTFEKPTVNDGDYVSVEYKTDGKFNTAISIEKTIMNNKNTTEILVVRQNALRHADALIPMFAKNYKTPEALLKDYFLLAERLEEWINRPSESDFSVADTSNEEDVF